MALYRIQDVYYSYSRKPVLNGVSLEIIKGDFIGLLGPNGSGKTTLLKLLAGILTPDRGKVMLGNEEIGRIDPQVRAKKVGVVPQEINLDFPFLVEEVIAMGRYPYLGWWGSLGVKDREQIQEALETTGLSALKKRLITELSGGEKQRCVIARALAQNPEVLLLDEPVSNLDIRYQQEIFELLRHLNEEKQITVIVICHDLNMAAQYCRRLAMLAGGKLRGEGTPRAVLAPGIVEEVYGVAVEVTEDEATHRPRVSLLPRKERRKIKENGMRIHIIGGGGSASSLLYELHRGGYELSLGVVNGGDTDAETGRRLGLPRVLETPFLPITGPKRIANMSMMREADLIIIADVPFGPGNISNLEQTLALARAGKKVLRITGQNIKDRDFAGGKAVTLWRELSRLGAVDVLEESLRQYLEEVKKSVKKTD